MAAGSTGITILVAWLGLMHGHNRVLRFGHDHGRDAHATVANERAAVILGTLSG
jgi:hypothetical protein